MCVVFFGCRTISEPYVHAFVGGVCVCAALIFTCLRSRLGQDRLQFGGASRFVLRT